MKTGELINVLSVKRVKMNRDAGEVRLTLTKLKEKEWSEKDLRVRNCETNKIKTR